MYGDHLRHVLFDVLRPSLGAGFIKLFVRKFVRTKRYEVRKCDSQNFRTKFVKIRCVSGRERNKPIMRYYTTEAAATGKSFYTERKKACS